MNQHIDAYSILRMTQEDKVVFITPDSQPLVYHDVNGINATISDSADKIYQAISHPPVASFNSTALYIALIAGLCATTVAFIYNKIHWYSVRKRDARIKIAETIIEIVTLLDESSVDYWMRNYAKKLSRDNKKTEIKIKSYLGQINILIPSVVQSVSFMSREKNKKELSQLHSDLYDLITGDDFETSSRKVDVVKADQISNKCLTLRVMLTKLCI